MNDNFNSIRLGNIAFNKDEYADAIRCYTAASNSNMKPIKSDALLNRALAHKKLGLTQHARNDFSEAVNISYKSILIDSVKKKVLPSDDVNDQADDDYDNNSNYGNLFQQFHSNNSYIHSHYNYNNHKKIKNTSKIQLGLEEPLENCFSNSCFFLECSRIQDLKEQNTYQYTSSYKRRSEFNKINEYISAMQDAQSGIALGPHSPNYWLIKAKASFTLRQLETALECVHFFEQRKHQNLNKTNSNNSNSAATINVLKKLYSDNSSEGKQIGPNLSIQQPITSNWEINNSRLFRLSLNITRGRISEVLYDDPTHPLVLFATRELPSQLASIILNRSPFLYYLLEAIRKTLLFPGLKLYQILKPDLGIDSFLQEKWFRSVKGVPRLILQLFPQITSENSTQFEISDDSDSGSGCSDDETDDHEISTEKEVPLSKKSEKEGPIPKNFASKLMEQAILIGKQICPERSSLRDAALSGLAVLEISQLIRNWSYRNNTNNINISKELDLTKVIVFPSFELIVAIVASWLRFSYPNFPIFPSRGIPNSSENVELVCSGIPHNQSQFDTYASQYAHKIIESLVSHSTIADSISLFGGIGVDEKRPETILAFTKTPVNVILNPSKARVYLRQQHFGTYDFGIVIGEDEVERDKNYDQLGHLWESIIHLHRNDLNSEKSADLGELSNETITPFGGNEKTKKEKPLNLIFDFWFKWTLTQPLLSYSSAAGQIIFAALIHSFFGLAVSDGMLVDSDLKLDAFLVNDSNEFMNNMMKRLSVKFVGNEFESVIDTLPDMQYRAAMLLDVPDDNYDDTDNQDNANEEPIDTDLEK